MSLLKGFLMKVKFISTTNDMMKRLYGYQGELVIELKVKFTFKLSEDKDAYAREYDFWIQSTNFGTFSTSVIEHIDYIEVSKNCWIIKIQTYNSEYIFEFGERTKEKPTGKRKRQLRALSMMF